MDVDRGFESLLVAETSGVAVDLLNHGNKVLVTGVGRTGDHCRQDALEMRLERSRNLLGRLEARADRPVAAAHPDTVRPASDLVVP